MRLNGACISIQEWAQSVPSSRQNRQQVDHPRMVINLNETKLRTIAQLQDFLKATPEVSFSGIGEKDDGERYARQPRTQAL